MTDIYAEIRGREWFEINLVEARLTGKTLGLTDEQVNQTLLEDFSAEPYITVYALHSKKADIDFCKKLLYLSETPNQIICFQVDLGIRNADIESKYRDFSRRLLYFGLSDDWETYDSPSLHIQKRKKIKPLLFKRRKQTGDYKEIKFKTL